jgi:S1-C subfamily serine protease
MKKDNILKQIIFAVGVVALAVSAGAAAAAILVNSLIGSVSTPMATVAAQARPSIIVNGTKVSESVRSAVSIYKKRNGTSPLDKVLLPADEAGAGAVLTADGWIVTAASVVSGTAPLTAVFADKTTATVDPAKAVRDDATGLAFIKTEGQRLTVASFGDDAALHASDPVFFSDSSSVSTAAALAPRRLPVSAKADYVESTEKLARRIITDKTGLAGAPAVDASGLVVGVSLGDGTAVPATFITQVMRSLFRDGKVSRPRVGLHFVSLDGLPNAKDAGLATTGALVTGGGKYAAVAKGSAAEAAGILDGDVIIAVEHDRINEEAGLSERLQDYVPGARVELTVVRSGGQKKISLTLK